jgi:hypothetical protein
MLATRPMNVTAWGPAYRSQISHSVYSDSGCHCTAGGGARATWSSVAVKPSPIGGDELGGSILFGEVEGVNGKKAWIEVFLFEGGIFAGMRILLRKQTVTKRT